MSDTTCVTSSSYGGMKNGGSGNGYSMGDSSNLIKLCLNKPKTWNWELSTSKSSPNIAFPKIQLYDSTGVLLAETDDSDCLIRGGAAKGGEPRTSRRGSALNIPEPILENKDDEPSQPFKISHGRSRSWQDQNSTREFNRTSKDLENKSLDNLKCNNSSQDLSQSSSKQRKLKKRSSSDGINLVLNELVSGLEKDGIKCKIHKRSSKELNSDDLTNVQSYQIGKSKSTTLIPITNTISTREKKRYRRAHSVNSLRFSSSILERISEYKRSTSSTESEEEVAPLTKRSQSVSTIQDSAKADDDEDRRPKYTLRTSKAGTLIVCEESFRHRRVRTRRPRSSSRPLEEEEKAKEDPDDSVQVYSPEKVKTEYEYIGNPAQNKLQEDEEEAGRYQKEIDNIERMLVNLGQPGGTRRHKSLNENAFDKILREEKAKKEEKKKKRISFEEKVAEMSDGKSSAPAAEKKKGTEGVDNRTVIDPLKPKAAVVSGGYDGVRDKLLNRKQFRRMRRSLSADCERTNQSPLLSSSDEEDGKVEVLTTGRSRRTKRKPQTGDQVVAINNSGVSLTRKEQPSTCLIEPTDQVLLRLVRRLASLQQQQQQGKDFKDLNNNNNNNNTAQKLIDGHYLKTTSHSLNPVTKDLPNVDSNNSNNDINKSNTSTSSRKRDPLSSCQSFCDKTVSTPQKQLQRQLDKENIMGSNVSRQSSAAGKGLTGRRSLSSGNLCNGKPSNGATPGTTSISKSGQTPKGGRGNSRGGGIVNRNFNGNDENENPGNGPDDTCSLNTAANFIMTPINVNRQERNKFCGSLPNHLDVDVELENDRPFVGIRENRVYDASLQQRHGQIVDQNEEKVEYVTVGPRGKLPQQPQGDYGKQSSPYNSSSGKGSITSTSNLGSNSTFKSDANNKLELKLPTHRVNFDPSCDQGYGSERSPEDEVPPSLPSIEEGGGQFGSIQSITQEMFQQAWSGGGGVERYDYDYDFITKDCTFFVQIIKGPRGLGLSISGGIDSNAAFPGLIRIKRLFPHQAAWATGMLQPGDIILEVNGVTLSGLTNYEALEVLRTTPDHCITLTICRPNDEQYKKLSPPTEPPKPPQRTSLHPNYSSFPMEPLSPLQTNFSGEFEIIMVKQQGSLGFTLRKEDESVLGHYVRCLVREPATTDGRIKPGDKIVAVNDVPMSPMTHEEAVIFLRQADDTVKLRLFRDVAQTPVAALSPTNPDKGFAGTLKSKTYLRPEAINLLTDLAYRKQTPPCDSSGSSVKSSNNTSPRRLRRGLKNNHGAGGNSAATNRSGTPTSFGTTSNSGSAKYVVCGQTTSNSDSDASTLSQNSFAMRLPIQAGYYQSSGAEGEGYSSNDTYTIKEDSSENDDQYYRNEEIQDGIEDDEYDVYDANQPRLNRPQFLDLGGPSGSTPVVSRKPMYQFSMACNGYELNNLDNEMLDAPIYQHLPGASVPNGGEAGLNQLQLDQFASLPCETFIVACKTESDLMRMAADPVAAGFHHKNPIYQSAHVPATKDCNQSTSYAISGGGNTSSDEEPKTDSGAGGAGGSGTKSLLKWKGMMLTPKDEKEEEGVHQSSSETIKDNGLLQQEGDLEQITTAIRQNEPINIEGYKVLSLELNRGWNSRLGFSLKTDEQTRRAHISAIYCDSVAARDGRLHVRDQLIRVNDEPVENMTTNQIIDLLRIIRGAICLTVLRKYENCDTVVDKTKPDV